MDEEQQSTEKSLTVGDIFRMVKKRLAIILVACLAFTLVCVLLLVFLINPRLTTYTIGFRLMFPTRDTAAYPDGSPFFYQDIVSEGYLKEAQAASPDFSTVKVESMVKENSISVTIAEDEDGVSIPEGPYTLRMGGTYFLDADQAENFSRVLISVAVSKIRQSAREVNYIVSKNVFDSAPFAERLRLLAEQRDAILMQYNYWIGIYSEAYRVVAQGDETDATEETNGANETGGKQENTVTLGNRRAQVVALYGESIQQELENELDLGGYYSGDSQALEAYKTRLKLEYEQNKMEIDKIQGALSGKSGDSSSLFVLDGNLSERLSALITRNNRISHWLGLDEEDNVDETKATLTADNNEKFAARLDEEYEKLYNASDKLTKAIAAIYAQGTSVLFEEQSIVADGGINAVLGAVLSFVLSFAAACAIVCAVERSRARAAGVKKH